MVKVESAVVDAVESALESVVLATDAGKEVALGGSHGHKERVHAVVDIVGDELGEHHSSLSVEGGVTEVVLPRSPEGRIDNKLLSRRVILGGRTNCRNVRAVPGFSHGIDTRKLERHRISQPPFVVLGRSEVHDCRPEESPLHAALDLHGGVCGDKFLKRRQVSPVIGKAAELSREGKFHLPVLDEELELSQHALPMFIFAQPEDALHIWVGGECSRSEANVGPAAEELPAESCHIDVRRNATDNVSGGYGFSFYLGHVHPPRALGEQCDARFVH